MHLERKGCFVHRLAYVINLLCICINKQNRCNFVYCYNYSSEPSADPLSFGRLGIFKYDLPLNTFIETEITRLTAGDHECHKIN